MVLIARGRHLEAIRAGGVTVLSPFGDARQAVDATDDFAALRDADVVVFATKTWQLPDALASASVHLRDDALLIGLQNGVQSAELFRAGHPPDQVLGGTCRIISYVEEPGVIRHVGIPPTLTFGELEDGMTPRVEELQRVLHVGEKAAAVASEDILGDLWRKFLFFAPVSGVGSVARAKIGVIRTVPETRRLLHRAVHEVAEVGRAHGVGLGADDPDEAIAFIDRVPADGTSSMHRDFEAGNRTELDALSGHVSRLGAELGVPTPTHDFIYAALLPSELAARA